MNGGLTAKRWKQKNYKVVYQSASCRNKGGSGVARDRGARTSKWKGWIVGAKRKIKLLMLIFMLMVYFDAILRNAPQEIYES